MIKTNFNFVKGDTFTKGFVVENIQIPISQIYFTVKEKTSNKQYLFQKKLNDGIVQDENNTNRYCLTIQPEDTDNLKPGIDYIFDIEIICNIDSAPALKKTIIGGILKLDDWDVTSRVNEVQNG